MSTRMTVRIIVATLVLAGGTAWSQRTYVGAETCKLCHDEQAEWMRGGVHESVTLPGRAKDGVTGCESCHGPGSEHMETLSVDTIFGFRDSLSARDRSARCLECHGSMHPELNFRRSDHNKKQVACDSCHVGNSSEQFHSMRAADEIVTQAQPALCYECHADQRAGFSMPNHHPVREGFMECTDCHQPHGSFTLRQMKTRGNEVICGNCHEDVQGPFIFEHPSGRAAGCQSCHQPHGTANAKMLKRPQVQFLCLECHPNTSSFHDLSQTQFQNCTVCHSQIHGSNLDRKLLQ